METACVGIGKETIEQVQAFQPVIEAVLGEELDLSGCIELLIRLGIDAALEDLLGSQSPEVLLRSIQQLGVRHPQAVYGYIAETLRAGAAYREQERLRRRLGFQTPPLKPREAQDAAASG